MICMASVFSQDEGTEPITWSIKNDTLTISGNGVMPDFGPPHSGGAPPWYAASGSIKIIIIENGILNISSYAFNLHNVLSSINIPSSVTRIGSRAFFMCSGLTKIELPNSLTTIDALAFEKSALTSITIPNSVASIGNAAFYDCKKLTSITFPNSIIEFGAGAFDECGLASVINLNPVPYSINPLTFGYLNLSTITLNVPMTSVSAYQNADVWKEFNIVGIEIGVKDIEEPEPIIVIYPNPTTGTCSITIPEEFLYESSLTLFIYDNMGRLLQQIPIDTGTENYSLQLKHKAAGVYPVVLSNGRKSYKGKIVFH